MTNTFYSCYGHEQVAETLAAQSANAARMVVSRALARLWEFVDEPG